MRVALCQLPVSSDPSVNLGRVKAAVADAAAAGANLAVFPEGMQARFGTDLAAAAEATDGAFGQGLSEAAGGHGVAVVAGVFEPAPGGRVYNTAVAFDAGGAWPRHTGRSTCSTRSATGSPTRSFPATSRSSPN